MTSISVIGDHLKVQPLAEYSDSEFVRVRT